MLPVRRVDQTWRRARLPTNVSPGQDRVFEVGFERAVKRVRWIEGRVNRIEVRSARARACLCVG